MKYALLADVHANVEALRAVLGAVQAENVDAILCAGDIVGYGANPNECINLLTEAGALLVAGNHDRAAIGAKEPVNFGLKAKRALEWTERLLSCASIEKLSRLPLLRHVPGELLLFHAALHPLPNDDLHLSSPERIEKSLSVLRTRFLRTRIGIFGHTHRSGAWRARGGTFGPVPGEHVQLDDGAFYLINPGSVGQSRDDDPRAAFAVLNLHENRVVFRRVEYDVTLSMAKVATLEAETTRRYESNPLHSLRAWWRAMT